MSNAKKKRRVVLGLSPLESLDLGNFAIGNIVLFVSDRHPEYGKLKKFTGRRAKLILEIG